MASSPAADSAASASYGSRQSYAAAVDRLATLASGDRPVPLAGVADEILGVAALLERQPRLRRALSDPARTGEDRTGLLASVLEGKVAEDTQTLLRTLVAGYWSSGAELLTAVERLGIEALLASADSAGELAEVEDELFRFGQVVDGNQQLAAALGTSTTPAEQRAELAHTLLAGKARPATVRLVDLALRGFGGRNFASSLSRLVELSAERRDRAVAYITVAKVLTEAEGDRLAARLQQMYGREVTLKISVDPHIVGGMSVRVGSDLYDGTVARRLHEARAELAGKH
jgi:F-type H+-transporting ATPase subunit delta